jgi:cell division protein FtsW (lipid II flippase)
MLVILFLGEIWFSNNGLNAKYSREAAVRFSAAFVIFTLWAGFQLRRLALFCYPLKKAKAASFNTISSEQ